MSKHVFVIFHSFVQAGRRIAGLQSAYPLLLAALTIFSIAGGWAAARAVSRFSERRVPALIAIAAIGVVALWSVWATENVERLVETLVLGWFLLVLSAVDILALRLPNALTIPLVVIGLLLSAVAPISDFERGPVAHVAAAAVAYAVLWATGAGFRRWRGIEGLGLGDAKLFAAAGAWLGWKPLPIVLLSACLVGFLWVGIRSIFRGRSSLNERLPFGAPLCLAFWLAWLYSPLFY